MTILTVGRKEFERRVGKVTPELEKKITDMGVSRDVRYQVSGIRLNVAPFVRAIWECRT